jgi:hypothetical protein
MHFGGQYLESVLDCEEIRCFLNHRYRQALLIRSGSRRFAVTNKSLNLMNEAPSSRKSRESTGNPLQPGEPRKNQG